MQFQIEQRELSLANPFKENVPEKVAAERWEHHGKTVLEQAVEIVNKAQTKTSDAYSRTGLVYSWNDYTDAMQRGTVYLPSNASWKK